MRDWSVYRIQPRPTRRMMDASIDWPYMATDPRYAHEDPAEQERKRRHADYHGIQLLRMRQELRIPPSIGIISAHQILRRMGWPEQPPFWVGVPRANWEFRPLGTMARIVASMMFRHSPENQRYTRHRVMFIPKLDMFCRLGRLEFWIQPDIYELTGELVMGEPWQEGRGPSITLAELHSERDRQQVIVALDAYLERDGSPDPRFT